MAPNLHFVRVIYVNGNEELYDSRRTFASAQMLAMSLTTDSRYERVAEASIETDLYTTDSLKWWQNCHFRREGAVVEREW